MVTMPFFLSSERFRTRLDVSVDALGSICSLDVYSVNTPIRMVLVL